MPRYHRNRGLCAHLKILLDSPFGAHEKCWEQASHFSGADTGEGATMFVRKAQSPTKTFPVCLEGEVSNSVAPMAQIKIHHD